MNEQRLEMYWNDIPVEKENAADYPALCIKWDKNERDVRRILHDLSFYDNGDDYVLIRSGKVKGFYKTDNTEEIEAYRRECLNKGRSIFAPLKKCNRILNSYNGQIEIFNNLRSVRVSLGITQKDVCNHIKRFDKNFDELLLSKMENGSCLPTYCQLVRLAEFYAVEPFDLVAGGIIWD